eukprot:scaffold52861_cov74-Phaeocystis_antarctica.AAC.2
MPVSSFSTAVASIQPSWYREAALKSVLPCLEPISASSPYAFMASEPDGAELCGKPRSCPSSCAYVVQVSWVRALEPVAHLIVRIVVVLVVAKRSLVVRLGIAGAGVSKGEQVVEVAHCDLGHHSNALFVRLERRFAVHLEHVANLCAIEAGHLLLLRRAVQGLANFSSGVEGLLVIERDAHDED